VDALAVVRNDDYRTLQADVLAEGDVTGYGKVVELEQIRNALEAAEEVLHLVEAGSELDERGRGEGAELGQRQTAIVNVVEIGHEEEQIGGLLDGQEPGTGHVDATRALEVFNGGSGCGLQLDHVHAAVQVLRVDDNLHFERLRLHVALHRAQMHPQVVRVEDSELGNTLELVHVVLGHLRNLEQHQTVLVLQSGSSLHVGPRLVRHFHHKLGRVGRVEHEVENVEVDGGAHVVNVGQEAVLLALLDELVEQARVVESLVEVAVAGRVPGLVVGALNVGDDGHERLLVDAWVARLAEGVDGDLDIGVLLEQLLRVVVSVERVHEHQRHVNVVRLVQRLNLLHRQVEEGEVIAHRDDRLGPLAAHRRAETSVELDDHQLVEHGGDGRLVVVGQLAVGSDGILGQRLDLGPVNVRLGAQEAREEVAEAGQLLAVQIELALGAGREQPLQLQLEDAQRLPLGRRLPLLGTRIRDRVAIPGEQWLVVVDHDQSVNAARLSRATQSKNTQDTASKVRGNGALAREGRRTDRRR
ncbi:hypothetical protein PFISCL1PPCAC_8876, partial [Pristionchus fissidentatus]